VVAVVAVLAIGLGALTAIRSASWGNQVMLARYLVDINPRSTRAAMDLGEQYMFAAAKDPASPWYPLALAEFERASGLPQGSIMGEHGLLLMHADFGLPADPAWWARLEHKLTTGPLRPQDVDALTGMVEQRAEGLALDGVALGRACLAVARRRSLAPALLGLYGSEAYKANGLNGPAPELFARALASPLADDAYRARMRQGIERIGGTDLVARAEAIAATLPAD
jgi:hypothetical protein